MHADAARLLRRFIRGSSAAVALPVVLLMILVMGALLDGRVAASGPAAAGDENDSHFRMESLLSELGSALSTNPDDIGANDALLRHVKSRSPNAIANLLLLSLDGGNIGNAVGDHAAAGDREYFQRALASERLVIGKPVFSRSNVGLVIPIAAPVRNKRGEVQAILVVAVKSDAFQKWSEAPRFQDDRATGASSGGDPES